MQLSLKPYVGSESMMVKGYDFKSILTSNETLYDF